MRHGSGAARGVLAAAGLLLASGAAHAADEDKQLWLQTSVSVKLDERWSVSNETNIRFSDARNGLYEIESNSLLAYRLGKAMTLAAGYTHDPQYAGGSFTVMERRAREQISFDNVAKIGGGALSLRLRAEQRWRDGMGGTGWRLRPYARYMLPLVGRTALILGMRASSTSMARVFRRTAMTGCATTSWSGSRFAGH